MGATSNRGYCEPTATRQSQGSHSVLGDCHASLAISPIVQMCVPVPEFENEDDLTVLVGGEIEG